MVAAEAREFEGVLKRAGDIRPLVVSGRIKRSRAVAERHRRARVAGQHAIKLPAAEYSPRQSG